MKRETEVTVKLCLLALCLVIALFFAAPREIHRQYLASRDPDVYDLPPISEIDTYNVGKESFSNTNASASLKGHGYYLVPVGDFLALYEGYIPADEYILKNQYGEDVKAVFKDILPLYKGERHEEPAFFYLRFIKLDENAYKATEQESICYCVNGTDDLEYLIIEDEEIGQTLCHFTALVTVLESDKSGLAAAYKEKFPEQDLVLSGFSSSELTDIVSKEIYGGVSPDKEKNRNSQTTISPQEIWNLR